MLYVGRFILDIKWMDRTSPKFGSL